MAKKTKDTTVTKKSKDTTPADPAKTKDLLRLLSTLAVLLSIAAFLLQLFAVLTHHWKWQVTHLRPLISSGYHYAQPNIYEDSRLQQTYGLYSRDVKLYANNDEQFDVCTSTRFPRVDEGEENFHQCLAQTSTLRGGFLTCSNDVNSPEQCHCRRYPYWKWVIFFEIAALILLGIVVFLAALQSTTLGDKIRPVAAGLAFLAFLFLLFGLILILSHLKRETRSYADAYPHIHQRVADELAVVHHQNQVQQSAYRSPLRQTLRRRSIEFYRAYPLAPGQHPYNDTHFQEYSEAQRTWIYRPYSSINPNPPVVGKGHGTPAPLRSQQNSTAAPLHSSYGPAIGYDQVYDATRAGIGPSTILSILSLIPALLLPLLLAYGLLTAKKLTPTTTTVKKDYTSVPLNPPEEHTTTTHTTAVRTIPRDYSHDRPVGDALITTQNVPHGHFNTPSTTPTNTGPVIVKDVIIGDPAVPSRGTSPTTPTTTTTSTTIPTITTHTSTTPITTETTDTRTTSAGLNP